MKLDQATKDHVRAAVARFAATDPHHEFKSLSAGEVRNYADLLGTGSLPTEDLDVAWLLLTIVDTSET
jgi:hypothetical protein